MNTDLDTSRVVRSWLRTDEHESADRVLDTVLALLDATPQHRSSPVRTMAIGSSTPSFTSTASSSARVGASSRYFTTSASAPCSSRMPRVVRDFEHRGLCQMVRSAMARVSQ